MASEMQERIARAIYESRAGRPARDKFWAHQVKAMRELADEFPEYPLGGDGVSDAFRDALAVMKAMREPTKAQGHAALNLTGKEGHAYAVSSWMLMIDTEIKAAEEG